MARVTVEDCMQHIPNKYQLSEVASKRARQLAYGAATELDWDGDKPTVMALREVAEGIVGESILTEKDNPIFAEKPKEEDSK